MAGKAKKGRRPATKVARAPARKKTAPKKAAAKPAAEKAAKGASRKRPVAAQPDFSAFPAESLDTRTLGLCLACVLDIFTRHMGLSPERAHSEIRRYNPSLEEVSAETAARPYMAWPVEQCPYCSAAPKWLAAVNIARIEGGKNTDTARRALVKNIGKSAQFAVIEEKSSERDALYSWLAKTGEGLDLDSPAWLLEAARHWLGRRVPKVDWAEVFKHIRSVRRSRRIEQDFEVETPRLFLAPELFDEVLLIQYLLSRSHKAGGQTFEGRMTLLELFHRLRGGGYLSRMEITTRNASEALEQLIETLGGEGRVKFHYIIDRRDLLERLAQLKVARLPRPKPSTRPAATKRVRSK